MTVQVRIHAEVRATPCDKDGSVLINLESGKVFSLNGVGAKVWMMLEQGLSFESLLHSLALEYDVSREQLHNELETFIHELEYKGLIADKQSCGLHQN